MKEFVWIAAGGALGASARYALSLAALQFRWSPTLATLTANVIGSFLIGLVAVAWLGQGAVSSTARLAVMVGVLGGLTTFSTFSLQTIALLEQGFAARALVNIAANLMLCLALCWCGMLVGRLLR